jgi:ABC-2 type transport system permease protein
MRGFYLVFAMTLRQLLSRKKAVILVIIALFPAGLGVIARFFGAPYPDSPFLGTVPNLFNSFLVQILALFYGASVLRDGIEDRTANFILTTPTSRRAYVLGAWAALVVNLLLLLELAILAAFLTWGAGLPDRFSGGVLFGPECLSLMGAVAIGILVYSAGFMLLGLYTRHSAVVGVVYYMVFEAFLGMVPGPARRLALSAHLDALLDSRFVTRRMFGAAMFDRQVPLEIDVTMAAVTLTIVFGALMTLLVTRAARHDFVDLAEAGK